MAHQGQGYPVQLVHVPSGQHSGIADAKIKRQVGVALEVQQCARPVAHEQSEYLAMHEIAQRVPTLFEVRYSARLR